MLNHRARTDNSARVGLDIGSRMVVGVELVGRGTEKVVRSAGAVEIPGVIERDQAVSPSQVIHAIKSLWSSAGFESRRVVVALSGEDTYLKWLNLEAGDEEELGRTAIAAAARGAPFPAENAVVDYRVLTSRGDASSSVKLVMLVAASSAAIDGLLNTVETAGLEPIAVDVRGVAAVRSCQLTRKTANQMWGSQPVAHCIIGESGSTITVVRNDDLEFARTVPVGSNDFADAVVQATGCDWATAQKIKSDPRTRLVEGSVLVAQQDGDELRVPCDGPVGRLARETIRSLRFFSSQFAEGSYLGMIGAVALSGAGALLKGIDTCIREHGVDVTGVANPFAGLAVASEGLGVDHVGDKAALYTTAVGLALGDYSQVGAQGEMLAAA